MRLRILWRNLFPPSFSYTRCQIQNTTLQNLELFCKSCLKRLPDLPEDVECQFNCTSILRKIIVIMSMLKLNTFKLLWLASSYIYRRTTNFDMQHTYSPSDITTWTLYSTFTWREGWREWGDRSGEGEGKKGTEGEWQHGRQYRIRGGSLLSLFFLSTVRPFYNFMN